MILRNKNVLIAAATLALAGCSGGGGGAAAGGSSGGGGGGVTPTTTNIVGKVTTSNTLGWRGEKPTTLYEKVVDAVQSFSAAPSGCTASAYDLNGSTALASAAVANDGTFTIASSSLTAGAPYKIVTSCSGGIKLSAVVSADAADPTSKTPATVNPVSTLIATQIVKAIITAVTTATNNLPQAAQDAVKAALLKPEFISNIVTAVTSTIQSAIDYGSMTPPSTTAAATMTDAVAVATDSNAAAVTTADNAYKNDPDGAKAIPPSIDTAVTSSGKSAAALPACDSSLASTNDNNGNPIASASLCAQAVAKIIYNDVHFQVGVKLSGGAFGNVACSSNDAKLGPAFPNAKFTAHTGTAGADNVSANIPSGMCAIESTLPSLDRNQSYSSGGGGDHGGMVFFETFTDNGVTFDGVLTGLGTALYGGYRYHLSNLDQIVFGYGATTGGMNARLVYIDWSYDFANGGARSKTYKLLSTDGTTNSVTAFQGWPTCYGGSSPCNPGDSSTFGGQIDATWANAAQNGTLATAIAASSWTGSVFLKQFGGQIPNFDQMKTEITDAKAHADYNRTGQAKFFVLYSKQPDWNNPNCQYGSNTPTSYTQITTGVTSTKCLATDGTEEPAVRVNVTFTAADQTTGLTQIATMVKHATGRFFLVPQSPGGGFTGIFQLMDSTTGRILIDENFRQRGVFIVTDASSQAGQHGVPGQAADGDMYNANISWNCSGQNSPCTLSYTASGAKINNSNPANAYVLTPSYNTNMLWSMNGPGLIGAGRYDGQNYTQSGPAFKAILVTVDAQTGAVTAAANAASAGQSQIPQGQYGIQPHMNCAQDQQTQQWNCTPAGYWLIGSDGTPFVAQGTLDTGLQASTDSWCAPQGGCQSPINPTQYSDAYFANLGGSVFAYADAGGQGVPAHGTWAHVSQTIMIPSGPAANPTFDCRMEPFFVDANSNGRIDATTDPNTGAPVCSELTFSGTWDAAQYVAGQGPYQDPGNGGHCSLYSLNPALCGAHANVVISSNRENSYLYGDPSAVTSLLQKAFGPLMDGKHSLTDSTDLNALQAFGLIYILMSQHSNDGTHVEGILAPVNNQPRTSFEIVTPICNGDSSAGPCNAAIGKGLLNYKQ